MNAKESAVRKFLALFHATDLDLPQIREALAHNARWQPVVPLARPVEGVEAICAEAERQYRIYTDCACEILNIATSGNTVFTERVDRVRLLADDREVVTRVVGIFDMDDDDKIVWWREYWDALDIAGQIGGSGEQMKAIMETA
ncbi:MAG TPA: limonene-1,2-epoxide hydrolase family protein [Rhizorhapis sp.]